MFPTAAKGVVTTLVWLSQDSSVNTGEHKSVQRRGWEPDIYQLLFTALLKRDR